MSIQILNIKRLIYLRIILIILECLLILFAIQYTSLAVIVPIIVKIQVIQILIIFATIWQLRNHKAFSQHAFFAHLVIDTLVFTLLFYDTGGASNPFISLLILPVFTVSVTLPKVYAWIMSGMTVFIYSLLMFFYHPLFHEDHGLQSGFGFHIQGMWLGFLLSVALIIFFVIRLSQSLRERDLILSQAKEQELRDQNLVALGTLATGTAHELGTPLSTMAVIANDFCHELGNDPSIHEKSLLLRCQIERCKTILSDMTARAKRARLESGRDVFLDEFIRHVIKEFKECYPGHSVAIQFITTDAAPNIMTDITLTQALINILNNAADVSQTINMNIAWNNQDILISIIDEGPGLNHEMLMNAGTPFLSTKQNGQGLGLYLAFSVIKRLKGNINLKNRTPHGLVVDLRIPLSALLVDTNES